MQTAYLVARTVDGEPRFWGASQPWTTDEADAVRFTTAEQAVSLAEQLEEARPGLALDIVEQITLTDGTRASRILAADELPTLPW
jgi:hypothetical protein